MNRFVLFGLALVAAPLSLSAFAGNPHPHEHKQAHPAAKVAAHKAVSKAAGIRTRKVIKHVAKKCRDTEASAEGHVRKAVVRSIAAQHAWHKEHYKASLHLTLDARMHAKLAAAACNAGDIAEVNPLPEETEAAAGVDEATVKPFLDKAELAVKPEAELMLDPNVGLGAEE